MRQSKPDIKVDPKESKPSPWQKPVDMIADVFGGMLGDTIDKVKKRKKRMEDM